MQVQLQSFGLPARSLIPRKQIKHAIVLEPFSRDKINQTQGNTIFWQGTHLKITEKTNRKLQLLWLGIAEEMWVQLLTFNMIIKVVHTIKIRQCTAI